MMPKLQIFGFSTEILLNFLCLVKMPWEILIIILHVEKLALSSTTTSVFDVLVPPKNNSRLQRNWEWINEATLNKLIHSLCLDNVSQSFQVLTVLINLSSIFLEKCLFGSTLFLFRSSISCKSVFMCQMLLERFLWAAGIGCWLSVWIWW